MLVAGNSTMRTIILSYLRANPVAARLATVEPATRNIIDIIIVTTTRLIILTNCWLFCLLLCLPCLALFVVALGNKQRESECGSDERHPQNLCWRRTRFDVWPSALWRKAKRSPRKQRDRAAVSCRDNGVVHSTTRSKNWEQDKHSSSVFTSCNYSRRLGESSPRLTLCVA